MKRILAFLPVLIFMLVAVATVAAVGPNKNASQVAVDNANIPEKSGDYAIKGRSDLRVRVFVYGGKNHAKGGIPGPNPKDPTPTPGDDPTPTPTSEPTPTPNPVACEDPTSNAQVASTGWYLPNTTINYTVNESSAPSSVGGSVFSAITESGFDTWTGVITASSTPNLVYNGATSKNRNSFDGENIVTFGRTQRTTLGVNYVWYYTATGEVAEVDTIMNQRIPWVYNACTENAYEIENILVHEQGHWYGLDDHYTSSFVNNTMYGYGDKAETKKRTPEVGDINGLNLIY